MLSPLWEIMVAEHDGEGRFWLEAQLMLFLRKHTKEIAKT